MSNVPSQPGLINILVFIQESVKNETCRPGSQHTVPGVFNANFTEECWVDENNNINNTTVDEEPCLEPVENDACDNRSIYCESGERLH